MIQLLYRSCLWRSLKLIEISIFDYHKSTTIRQLHKLVQCAFCGHNKIWTEHNCLENNCRTCIFYLLWRLFCGYQCFPFHSHRTVIMRMRNKNYDGRKADLFVWTGQINNSSTHIGNIEASESFLVLLRQVITPSYASYRKIRRKLVERHLANTTGVFSTYNDSNWSISFKPVNVKWMHHIQMNLEYDETHWFQSPSAVYHPINAEHGMQWTGIRFLIM